MDWRHPLVVGALICAGLAVWLGIVRFLSRLCGLNDRDWRLDEDSPIDERGRWK